MYKTITQNEFIDDLTAEGFGFTYDGASALYDYLEEFNDIEYDSIALRCEYSQYTKEELFDNYWHSVDFSDCEDDDEKWEVLEEYINNNTSLIHTSDDDIFVIADF